MWGCPAAVHVEERYSPKRPYLGTRVQQQGDVIEDRQHQDAGLALLLLRDRLRTNAVTPLPPTTSLLLKRRVDVIALPPLPDQRIESLRQRVGAWVVVEVELGIELAP